MVQKIVFLNSVNVIYHQSINESGFSQIQYGDGLDGKFTMSSLNGRTEDLFSFIVDDEVMPFLV